MIHAHMLVKGQVQGVGFRYYVQMKAMQGNIRGWVKNLPDSSVEIAAEGSSEALQSFVREVKKGSPLSIVEDVVIDEKEETEGYSSFDITY
ncbi:acylphosphatase [Metabacillus sp. RGM 3146]|uniref:acylphosphatase n=1 Tax=Metabacillus sp. RGM 3146 TaxID=3401092 RepID=UPI003B9958A2